MNLNRQTINKEITFQGNGIHTGLPATLKLIPSDSGKIQIFRRDINQEIEVNAKNILKSDLSSSLGSTTCNIRTIEHLFATLHSFRITDLIIEIDSGETPIMDGSAKIFAEEIKRTGIKKLKTFYQPLSIKNEIKLTNNFKEITISPSDKLIIEYEINFKHPVINTQTFKIEINENNFMQDLAPARTFGFMRELEFLKSKGLALGASLNNAIGLSETGILNQDNLRFKDEFVRHKIIDLIGDIYLHGIPVLGHIKAKFAGHALHQDLLTAIINQQS